VHEAIGVSTNDAAQSSLTAIEILALCADRLPNEMPPLPESPFTGRGGRGRQTPGGSAAGNPVAPKADRPATGADQR
jgi:hypothetical protein